MSKNLQSSKRIKENPLENKEAPTLQNVTIFKREEIYAKTIQTKHRLGRHQS